MLFSALKQLFKSLASETKQKEHAIDETLALRETLPARTIPTLDRVGSFFSPVFWLIDDSERFSEAVKNLTQDMPPGYHASDTFIAWGRNNSMFDVR